MFAWLASSNVVTYIVGMTTFWLLLGLFTRFRRRTPPGPWGFPLLGCLPHLIFTKESMRTVFQNWYFKYGPIYNLKLGTANVIVLNDYRSVKEALVRPEFQDRARLDFLLDRAGAGVVLSNGRVWQEQRRFVHQHFRDFGIGKSSFEDAVATEAKCLTDALLKFDGESVSIERLINNAVSNVIASVTFGRRFSYDDKSFQTVLEKFNENMEASMLRYGLSVFLPITKYLPFGGSSGIRENLRTYFNFHDDMTSEHKSKFDESNTRDMMDAYLNEIKKNRGNGLSDIFNDDNMSWTIADLFTAGTETTTTTLLWAFLFLLKNPEVEARIREDLDSVIGRNRLPRYSDRQNLPYVEAVLSECLRLGTTSGLSLPHVASCDSTLEGFEVPKGTLLIPNFHAVFTDNNKWERPHEFRPERFLDKEGNFIKREDFIPFGAGRRLCIGEQLARMELFIFLTYTLQHMTFSIPEGTTPPPDRGIDGFTHKPRPYNVFVKKCSV